MEEAKEVIKIATNFLAEQEPEAKTSRLEQIEERSTDGKWSVVLSFPDLTSPKTIAFTGNGAALRVYKELVVNSRAKEVMALKFWNK